GLRRQQKYKKCVCTHTNTHTHTDTQTHRYTDTQTNRRKQPLKLPKFIQPLPNPKDPVTIRSDGKIRDAGGRSVRA
ncbi:MAG: hypothetical protein ACK56I_00925, partial [bacterium]